MPAENFSLQTGLFKRAIVSKSARFVAALRTRNILQEVNELVRWICWLWRVWFISTAGKVKRAMSGSWMLMTTFPVQFSIALMDDWSVRNELVFSRNSGDLILKVPSRACFVIQTNESLGAERGQAAFKVWVTSRRNRMSVINCTASEFKTVCEREGDYYFEKWRSTLDVAVPIAQGKRTLRREPLEKCVGRSSPSLRCQSLPKCRLPRCPFQYRDS